MGFYSWIENSGLGRDKSSCQPLVLRKHGFMGY